MNNCKLSNVYLLGLIFLVNVALLFVLSSHVKTNGLVFIIPALVCFIAILIPCKKKKCKHSKFSIGFGCIIPGTRIYRFPIQCGECKEYFFMEIDNEKQTTKFYSIDKEVLDL